MVAAEPSRGRLGLPEKQRSILEQIVRRTHCPKIIALRAGLVLAADEGLAPTAAGKRLGCSRELARRWRDRFANAQAGWTSQPPPAADPAIADVDAADARLTGQILDTLEDRPRSGPPRTFTPTQLCQIMSLACEKRPEECGRPVTHWTSRELADEAARRGIVPSISPRHVGRFLKKWIFVHIAPATGSTAPTSGKNPRNSSAVPGLSASCTPQRHSCTSRACIS
ncbi:MAG: helix-turn-helix domain-containing protein [Planctomycetota bacterium]|nr:helix-turn-helix domain-containing protein [Planctomycetota bacterium]